MARLQQRGFDRRGRQRPFAGANKRRGIDRRDGEDNPGTHTPDPGACGKHEPNPRRSHRCNLAKAHPDPFHECACGVRWENLQGRQRRRKGD